ncbi:hypothetical protein SAMN04488038_12510 [Solimonas aquatica]|uniref:TadE-like protein n=1 Tax=Solimonas aquatica TaxID=489703 RepID=A0A1H9MK09_9GAMM|nr:hypothetical protein [Solimonas aquatica]SER24054.1 hypothetical protein SAMN04488038_12510 [Solimonas aquatica]
MPLRSGQKGQALTEFLLSAAGLLSLFSLLPMIGKYQDIRHAVQMASRYVAFDATTHNGSVGQLKAAGQLQMEVARRYFSNADAPIKTGDKAGDFAANRKALWNGPDGASLLAKVDTDVKVRFGPNDAPDPLQGFSDASDGGAFLLHQRLSLKARGLYTGGVSVSLANLPAGIEIYEPFDQLDLQMTRRTAVLIDQWAGDGPGSVQSHLDDPIVNAGLLLKPIRPVVAVAVKAAELPPWGKVPPPKLGELDFWQDTVPHDRLTP